MLDWTSWGGTKRDEGLLDRNLGVRGEDAEELHHVRIKFVIVVLGVTS